MEGRRKVRCTRGDDPELSTWKGPCEGRGRVAGTRGSTRNAPGAIYEAGVAVAARATIVIDEVNTERVPRLLVEVSDHCRSVIVVTSYHLVDAALAPAGTAK